MGLVATAKQRAASIAEQSRLERWELVRATYPDIGDWHVLDLGGTVESWVKSPLRPKHVTVVNLLDQPEQLGFTVVKGDATETTGGAFDLVFSNSLIEHVGGHAQRHRLADHVHSAAPRHWVQTPYRYFPVEPHWLFPGAQFLPIAGQARVLTAWPLIGNSGDRPTAVERAAGIELLSITQMRAYFPDSAILKEKAFGLTKSLVSVKR